MYIVVTRYFDFKYFTFSAFLFSLPLSQALSSHSFFLPPFLLFSSYFFLPLPPFLPSMNVYVVVYKCGSDDNCVSSFLLRSVPQLLSSYAQTWLQTPLCTESSHKTHLFIINEILLVTLRTSILGDINAILWPAISPCTGEAFHLWTIF